MTLLFFVFTSPGAIASQYYNVLVTSFNGKIVLFSMDCFAFSYHALNIIILCLTNKQFLRKFVQIAFPKKDNHRENTTQVRSQKEKVEVKVFSSIGRK
jgi:hypothetical protein